MKLTLWLDFDTVAMLMNNNQNFLLNLCPFVVDSFHIQIQQHLVSFHDKYIQHQRYNFLRALSFLMIVFSNKINFKSVFLANQQGNVWEVLSLCTNLIYNVFIIINDVKCQVVIKEIFVWGQHLPYNTATPNNFKFWSLISELQETRML